MSTSYILEIVEQGPFRGIVSSRERSSCPRPPPPHLCAAPMHDCELRFSVRFGDSAPSYIISHRSQFIAHGLFSISGFPSWAHTPFNQGFPRFHILPLRDAPELRAVFPFLGVSPSGLHFTLCFFKCSLVLGTGIPFSGP